MFKIQISEIKEQEVRRTYQENTVEVKLITDKEVYMQVVDELDLVKVINAINSKPF